MRAKMAVMPTYLPGGWPNDSAIAGDSTAVRRSRPTFAVGYPHPFIMGWGSWINAFKLICFILNCHHSKDSGIANRLQNNSNGDGDNRLKMHSILNKTK
jgi:hypothetical protein